MKLDLVVGDHPSQIDRRALRPIEADELAKFLRGRPLHDGTRSDLRDVVEEEIDELVSEGTGIRGHRTADSMATGSGDAAACTS